MRGTFLKVPSLLFNPITKIKLTLQTYMYIFIYIQRAYYDM